PSNLNPKRSAARREAALAASHFHSRRRLPSSSNACRAMTWIASVACRVRCSAGESQMWPISMTPCSGTMLISVAIPRAAPASRALGRLLFLAALAGKGARAIGLPAVIGYLVVGVLVSPFTPGYVANREQLSVLADVGVVLLLFEVGIEINPLRLAREGR